MARVATIVEDEHALLSQILPRATYSVGARTTGHSSGHANAFVEARLCGDTG